MVEIYLVALAVLLFGVLLNGLARPVRFFEYPYFMATAFTVFILPQAFSLIRFPGGARPQAVEAALLMTLLCAGACVLGYRAPISRWILEHSQIPLDDRRLFHFGVLFTVVGLIFAVLIGRMTEAERGGSSWTGVVTIYLFFSTLAYPGFSICFRRALLHGGSTAWLWAILGAWMPLVSGLIYARREPAILFMITIALTLFYCKGLVVPRWAAVMAIVGATLAIPATTKYRMAIHGEGFQAVRNIDLVENFRRYLAEPSILELRNAAFVIDSTTSLGLGTAYWDQLVFRFVPAQIFGREFKNGLMFRTSDERVHQEMKTKAYRIMPGSTTTGMADSFSEFGYFGALFFAVLAVIFKSLWHASLYRNAIFAQLLYIQISTSAMRAITHQTVDFLPGVVYNLIFIGLAALYARQDHPQGAARKLSSALR